MTEARLQQQVIDLARWAGFRWYHTVDSRKSQPGFPDLVLIHRTTGRVIYAELKSADGRVGAAQQEWLTLLDKQSEVYLWRPADWDSGEIRRVLTEGNEATA